MASRSAWLDRLTGDRARKIAQGRGAPDVGPHEHPRADRHRGSEQRNPRGCTTDRFPGRTRWITTTATKPDQRRDERADELFVFGAE